MTISNAYRKGDRITGDGLKSVPITLPISKMPDFHQLTISDIRKETENAVCLTFDVPADLSETYRFTQGQYLTLKAHIDGTEVRRSYSICSGIDDGTLRVAVKKVAGGVFSSYANENLVRGASLEVMPPRGTFFTPLDENSERNYLCIAAGSGITPIISIIKTILQREQRSQVTLLYGNQRVATMMFKEELEAIKNRYMTRFQWINILSRERQDVEILNGRINNRKGAELIQHLLDLRSIDEFFLCGPEAMISEVSRGLRSEGIDERKIHYELFAESAEAAAARVAKHHERAVKLAGMVAQVSVNADGRENPV